MQLGKNFNPYLAMMLAQLGAGLDPQGVGGAIGRTTGQVLQSMLVARALQQQDRLNKALLKALVGRLENPYGSLSSLGSLEKKWFSEPEADLGQSLADEESLLSEKSIYDLF